MSRKQLILLVVSAVLGAGCGAGGSAGAREANPAVAPVVAPVIAADSAKTQATSEPVAAPAAFIPAATTEPIAAEAPPSNLADVFDAQLQHLINPQVSPGNSIATLAPDEQKLVSSVIDCLATFRQTLRNSDGLMATRVAPLLELSERIRSQVPLTLPALALCRSVTQFGVYDSVDPARFAAGKETPLIIYCEVENFVSRPAATDSGFETKLSYEAVLYSDGEQPAAVIAKKPASIVDRCRNRRRDFFLADRLTLPTTLPAGKYLLKVTVIDQLANHVAEKTLPLLVAPD